MNSQPISSWSNKSATEEWPKIINTTRKDDDTPLSNDMIRVEYHEVKTKTTDDEPKKQIDIKNISANDLKSIRREDPFMYYSIPGVRMSKMLLNDDNDIDPSRPETVHGKAQETVVRKSRMSFECHPDLLLKEEFCTDEHDALDEDVDMEDPLVLLLSRYFSSSN